MKVIRHGMFSIVAILALFILVSFNASAAGLIINAAEIGVGKFHRYDNKIHSYPANNVWKDFATPDGAIDTPIIVPNLDKTVSIQFSTLEELVQTIIKVSAQTGQKILVLNITGHGLPGAMWYPKDARELGSMSCLQWKRAAKAKDEVNYDQYYSPVSKTEILQFRAASKTPSHYACTTGLPEWKEIVERNPSFKEVFAQDAQIHFLSCLVGLGAAGEQFTNGVAALVLKGGRSLVKSSTNFGLGDWSIPEGLGFWDYITDEQLEHDNQVYPVDRKDREIAQRGTVRVASFSGGKVISTLVGDQSYMMLGSQYPGLATPQGRIVRNVSTPFSLNVTAPSTLRVPGTRSRIVRER